MSYRYRLHRFVEPELTAPTGIERVAFVMLNPSTADDTEDDSTIRRLRGFAARWGAREFVVRNIFAWRATNPKALPKVVIAGEDVVGPENAEAIREAGEADIIVCAWGNHVAGAWLKRRAAEMIEIVAGLAPPKRAFGYTQQGHPVHPLYQSGDVELRPWPLASLSRASAASA